MVIVFEDRLFQKKNGTFQRHGVYMDDYLKYNLDNFLIKGIEKGHDGIMLVTGLEGTGKSTFTQQLACYCDRDKQLSLDRIVFSGKDLMEAIDKAKPGQSLIFDEAIMDMSSQDFASQMQKILIKKFTLIRKKRLLIFIVIPTFFMLRKYFAIFRTRAMINCICTDGITRGTFRFYSFSKKKKLYLRGYKEMDMGVVKPDFRGKFVDTYGFFIDAEAYEDKKDEAIKKLTEDEDGTEIDKLKQAFEDYKLKLKIDVDGFKEKWKEKFAQLNATNKERLKEEQASNRLKLEELKQKSILNVKTKRAKKIDELEIDLSKLLCTFYEEYGRLTKINDPSIDFDIRKFQLLLKNSADFRYTSATLKKYITQGKALNSKIIK